MKRMSKIILIVSTSIFVICFMYHWLFPIRLKIIIPKNYQGKITLVLSNVKSDNLNVNENGIGYITKQTFDGTYYKPIVLETDGTNISDRIVGFNSSTFWAIGKASNAFDENNFRKELEVRYLSFEVVPPCTKGEMQNYRPNLIEFIDQTKLLFNK